MRASIFAKASLYEKNYKVESMATGKVYFPGEFKVIVSLSRTIIQDLQGNIIPLAFLSSKIDRKDSSGEQLFENDRVLLQLPKKNGSRMDVFTIRVVDGTPILFGASETAEQLAPFPLSEVKDSVKISRVKWKSASNND